MATSKNQSPVDENTGEVTGDIDLYQEPKLSNAALSDISTSESDLLALVSEWGLTGDDLIIGDEFPLADKSELVDIPLFFVQWQFGMSSNFGTEYVQVKAVRLDTNEKIGIFDSGVGIYGALNALTEKRLTAGKPAYNGALVKKGLSLSSYPAKTDTDGNVIRPAGSTYYLA